MLCDGPLVPLSLMNHSEIKLGLLLLEFFSVARSTEQISSLSNFDDPEWRLKGTMARLWNNPL